MQSFDAAALQMLTHLSPPGRGRIERSEIRVRGYESFDRPYTLTPTLSPWERERVVRRSYVGALL